MRYELDANGYVKIVVWGCHTGNCAEYTGTVPSGYSNLTEWSEKAIINAYYINEQGNLTLDSNRLAELEAQIEQETIENQPVLYKDLYGTNNVLADQYQKLTVEDSVIEAENVKKINPEVFITNINSSKIDIVTQGKQMLKNDATSYCSKNICPTDVSDWVLGQWTTEGNTNTFQNRIRLKELIPCKPNTAYYVQSFLQGISFAIRTFKADGTFNKSIGAVYRGAKFTTDASSYYLAVTLYSESSTTDDLLALLESGEIKPFICLNSETDKNYEPYFKVTKGMDGSITIDGTAECGKNKLNLNELETKTNIASISNLSSNSMAVSSTGSTTYPSASFLLKLPVGSYTLSCQADWEDDTYTATTQAICNIGVYEKGTTTRVKYFEKQWTKTTKGTRHSVNFTIEDNELYDYKIVFYPASTPGLQGRTVNFYNVMINEGTTLLDYEPYLESIEYNICGGSNNTSSIFALKKDMDYYLDLGELECSMKYYDGTTRNIVYEGIDGVINLSESKEVTQVTLKIPTGVTFDNKVIYPMLNFGEFPYEYEEYKCKKLTVDLSDHIAEGTTINNIHIKEGQVYVRVNGEDKYLDKGNVNLFDGYNLVYPMQSSMIEMTYTINNLKLEGTKTKNNNFEILEDGSIVAHNGSFSGTITATEGEIGGFTLGVDKFTSDIVPLKDYTMDDLNKVAQYIRGEVTLTDEELESYDLNEDGIVNLKDMVLIQSLITTNVSTTEPGTLEINSKSPTKTLLIKDKDGNEIVNISLLGIKINGSGVGFDVDKVYPVGSIYMNINSDNPGDLFGGTWERIQGVFLLAGNDKYEEYKPGATGGSVTHSHGYGSLYAAIYNAGTSGHYYKTKTGVSFTANEQKKDTGAGATSTKACTEATQIYGNTGSANGMPPFLAVYVWKRTA